MTRSLQEGHLSSSTFGFGSLQTWTSIHEHLVNTQTFSFCFELCFCIGNHTIQRFQKKSATFKTAIAKLHNCFFSCAASDQLCGKPCFSRANSDKSCYSFCIFHRNTLLL